MPADRGAFYSANLTWDPQLPPFLAESPEALNEALLERKIVGGLPIECWYPELPNGVLLCATEMSRRQDMDTLAEIFAQTRELNRVAAR
jgi:glycine cleavage system pyridoxal-binding protein P